VEVFLHDGVMRAAKDQVFDLFAGKDVVDLRADLGVDVVLVEIAAVDECRKQGRALADDLALGRILVDELGVFAGGNGELRRDQADARELFPHDVFGGFLHDADDLIVKAGTKAVGEGGDGVAGDGGAFDTVVAEELEHIAAELKDLLRGFVAVRAVGAVAKVNDILTGKNALKLAHDGQSADAAVHHADGINCVQHG